MWQELHDELAPSGLVMLAVALDEDPEAVRQWAVDELPVPLTYPVLLDRDHLVAERYGILNIPTTVWIDEADRIVRPPAITPADDRFKDFTQINSSLHHEALRRWVHDGVAPLSTGEIHDRQVPADEAEQRARAERRLAAHLLRAGHRDAAARHLAAAKDLAPADWTIHRGSMPWSGDDPFGQAFFDYYQAWDAAGRPGYGS